MRFLAFILTALCSILMLSSCYATRQVPVQAEYDSLYVGRTRADIIREFGIPDRQATYEDVGEILAYEKYSTVSSKEVTSKTASNTETSPSLLSKGTETKTKVETEVSNKNTTSTQREYANFYFDDNKVCYQVRTNYRKEEKYVDKLMTTFFSLLWAAIIIVPIALNN